MQEIADKLQAAADKNALTAWKLPVLVH
jgi:hypothetical protein